MNNEALCRSLYREAFGEDDTEFENSLFDNCFKYCKFIKKNGKVVSMLFLLPAILETESGSQKSNYIYAAATLKEYRGKGYMAKLIDSVKSDSPLFLRPANEGLIAFYKKFGFKTVEARKTKALPCLKPAENFLTLAEKLPENESGAKYTAMYFASGGFKLNKLNFIYTME